MSTDKFLSTGGSGVTNLSNGSATIFASTLGAKNLDPSRPVKTNAVSQLVSDNLEISDINNLQSELDAGISNPLTSSLNFSNFSSINKTSGEFIKKSTGSVGNASSGSIKIYANTDGQFHSIDENGADTIIGNSGHVLGPSSVSDDGNVAIYNGTTGKILKDSNLTVDGSGHLDINGNFARYQRGVSFLSPTEINSLAAVGYVQQERDASNTRITTLETKTARVGVVTPNTTFVENTYFKQFGEGIDFECIIPPTFPMVHNITRQSNLFFDSGFEIFKRNINLESNSPAATNNVFIEKLTAAANIGGSSSAKDVDYEILTGSGTTLTTRLKIGGNGNTDIHGPDIRLFGNVRIGSFGVLELNFGSPSNTYTFPQGRPQAGQVLTGGTGDGALAWSASTRPYIFQDHKPAGSGGGTSAPILTWNLRDLNTSIGNTGTDATLAANQITLQPGTYTISGSAPAYAPIKHKIRLWNVTDGLAAVVGSSEHGGTVQTRSFIRGEVTILAPSVFQMEHWIFTERPTIGYGFYTGAPDTPEVYSEISIWKVI